MVAAIEFGFLPFDSEYLILTAISRITYSKPVFSFSRITIRIIRMVVHISQHMDIHLRGDNDLKHNNNTTEMECKVKSKSGSQLTRNKSKNIQG
jgi:hypothetical protein